MTNTQSVHVLRRNNLRVAFYPDNKYEGRVAVRGDVAFPNDLTRNEARKFYKTLLRSGWTAA